MKILILTSFLTTIIFLTKAQTTNFQWVKKMEDASLPSAGTSVTVDSIGNVYTVGWFYGTVDFDPGTSIFNLTSAGQDDIFISKLDASGNFIWAVRMGGNINDDGYDIKIDKLGNVYTTGTFYGTADFDPGTAIYNLTAPQNGGSDYANAFISKLDANGNFIWAKNIGNNSDDFALSIQLDNLNNVYTLGWFTGVVDFDPNSGTANLISSGSQDVFILKLSSSGNFVWAKKTGGVGADNGQSIILDFFGNIYSTGFFRGTADFDPGAGVNNLTSSGNEDVFISKLDSSGNFVWAKKIGGASDDEGLEIKLDLLGNIYATGTFSGTADFDPSSASSNLTSFGSSDVFIVKLNSLGNFVWAKKLGGTGYDAGLSIDIDASQNIYTTGNFSNIADFDPSTISTYNFTSVGLFDIFITKLDSSGNFIWAKQMGGVNNDLGASIKIDGSETIYTTGNFAGTADFDPDSNIVNLTATSSAAIFIHKMSQSTAAGITVSQSIENALLIYPNPNNGNFTIQTNTNGIYNIINQLGQIVRTFKTNETNNYSTNIDGLPNGIYIVQGIIRDELLYGKIIVTK